MSDLPESASWSDYRRLVLSELERLSALSTVLSAKIDSRATDIERKIDQVVVSDVTGLKVRVAMLEVRASIFGAIGGAVGGAIIATVVSKMH